jgi:ubiquitin related modifier 1
LNSGKSIYIIAESLTEQDEWIAKHCIFYLKQFLCSINTIMSQVEVLNSVIYSGGLETMFEGKKRLDLVLDDQIQWTLEKLIEELKRNHLKEKEEMFVQGSSVRPGIIVLVNDTDWELLDTTRYKVEAGDSVAFISTLHGG